MIGADRPGQPRESCGATALTETAGFRATADLSARLGRHMTGATTAAVFTRRQRDGRDCFVPAGLVGGRLAEVAPAWSRPEDDERAV